MKVVISDENGGVAPSETVTACAAYIESVRPIGAAVTVESATARNISVSATVELDSSVTLSGVKTQFEKAVSAYLKSLAFEKSEVVYSRIGFLLLDIPGVQDYSNLLLAGGTANVSIGNTQIPVLSGVTLNAAT